MYLLVTWSGNKEARVSVRTVIEWSIPFVKVQQGAFFSLWHLCYLNLSRLRIIPYEKKCCIRGRGKKVNQSCYRPGVAQSVSGT